MAATLLPLSAGRSGSNWLAETHLSLARSLAWAHVSRYPALDPDDVLSDAYLGLIHASHRFDASHGVPFGAFARARIRGAISDGQRERDPGSRADHVTISRAWEHRYAFAAEHGRYPTHDETARALERTAAELGEATARWVRSRRALMVNIDERVGETTFTYADIIPDPGAEAEMLSIETRDLLADYLPRLNSQQHMVIALYYWDEMTLAEIGDVLGVTESRAAQIIGAARERLREWLSADQAASDTMMAA